jgi:hypothetical protein
VDEQCRSASKSTTHLFMDSGAPITRRAGRVSKHNCAKTIAGENLKATVYIFWAYTRKISAIASGATPIGSTDCAPDDNGCHLRKVTGVIDYLFINSNLWLPFDKKQNRLLPSGVIHELFEEQLECFAHFNSQTRFEIRSQKILRLSHRDKAWMPWS